MRVFGVVCILLACVALAACGPQYFFESNATSISDPLDVLNFRSISSYYDDIDRTVIFRSTREKVSLNSSYATIDTIGGFVSAKNLPVALYAFWDDNVTWADGSIMTTSAKGVMASAVTAMFEKNADGFVVRPFILAEIISNNDAGVNWTMSTGQDVSGDLRWVEMFTMLPNYNNITFFRIEITWFYSAVRGQICLGNANLSPRMIESVVRVSGYEYQHPNNSLTLRFAVAHSSNSYTASVGEVTSGVNMTRVYTSLSPTAQLPPNPFAMNGTLVNVTVADWQSSSGLRNFISNSNVGPLLNDAFSSNWDVRYADVSLPPGVRDVIYDPTLGSGYEFDVVAPSPTDSSIPSSSSGLIQPSFWLVFVLGLVVILSDSVGLVL